MTSSSANSRILSIDILRAICVFCLILAHVSPPATLFQLRNFEVPFTFLLNGLVLATLLPTHRLGDYTDYVMKRFRRLVLSTWIFFTFLFGFMLLASLILNVAYPYSAKEIIGSYTLVKGIGFVWIIRLYFLIALTLPIVLWLHRNVQSNLRFLAICFACILSGNLMYLVSSSVWPDTRFNYALELTLFSVLPYAAVSAIGYRLPNLSNRMVWGMTALWGLILAAFLTFFYVQDGSFHPTQAFKYPPQLYYLSYAMLVSMLVYNFRDQIVNAISASEPFEKFMLFVGSNSLWIYLWHIFFLSMTNFMAKGMHLPITWESRFIFVIAASVIVVWFQRRIIDTYAIRIQHHKTRKYMLESFTG